MSPEEFARIKSTSCVLSQEELEAREQARRKEREAILVAEPLNPGLSRWGCRRGRPASHVTWGCS